jgi:hypothetical protein
MWSASLRTSTRGIIAHSKQVSVWFAGRWALPALPRPDADVESPREDSEPLPSVAGVGLTLRGCGGDWPRSAMGLVRVVMIKDRRRDELAMCRHAVDMTCQLAALRTLPEYCDVSQRYRCRTGLERNFGWTDGVPRLTTSSLLHAIEV